MTNRLSYLEAKIVSNSFNDLPDRSVPELTVKTFDVAIAPAMEVLGPFGISAEDVGVAMLSLNSLDDPMIFMNQAEVRDRLSHLGINVSDNTVDIPVLRDYPLWAKEIAETRESVIKDSETVELAAGKPPADIYADAQESLERHRSNLQILLDGTDLSEDHLSTMEEAANSTNSTLEISLVWLLEDIQRRKK